MVRELRQIIKMMTYSKKPMLCLSIGVFQYQTVRVKGHAQGHNTINPVRLKNKTCRSQVEHSTTELPHKVAIRRELWLSIKKSYQVHRLLYIFHAQLCRAWNFNCS